MSEHPINARAKITVNVNILEEVIYFFYFDPEQNYSKIKQDVLHNHDDELLKIKKNMQGFLDEDLVFLNGKRLVLNITDIEINFAQDMRHPILVFEVQSYYFRLRSGVNKFELDGEQQIATYPITAEWEFPGKIMFVSSQTRHQIHFNELVFSASPSEPFGGYEIITFRWKKSFID